MANDGGRRPSGNLLYLEAGLKRSSTDGPSLYGLQNLMLERGDDGAIGAAVAVAPVEAEDIFLDRRYPPARDRALALVALLVHLDDEGVEQRVVGAHALFITGHGEDVLPTPAADAVGRLDLLADC